MQLVPLVERLEQELYSIEYQVNELLDASTIECRPHDPYSMFAAIINHCYWGKTDEKQKHIQLLLLRKYLSWFEHFYMLFDDSPEVTQKDILFTHNDVRKLIEQDNGWNVPSTID